MLPLLQVHLMDRLLWEGRCSAQDQPEPGAAEQGLPSTCASASLTLQLPNSEPRQGGGRGGSIRTWRREPTTTGWASVVKNSEGID